MIIVFRAFKNEIIFLYEILGYTKPHSVKARKTKRMILLNVLKLYLCTSSVFIVLTLKLLKTRKNKANDLLHE